MSADVHYRAHAVLQWFPATSLHFPVAVTPKEKCESLTTPRRLTPVKDTYSGKF